MMVITLGMMAAFAVAAGIVGGIALGWQAGIGIPIGLCLGFGAMIYRAHRHDRG